MTRALVLALMIISLPGCGGCKREQPTWVERQVGLQPSEEEQAAARRRAEEDKAEAARLERERVEQEAKQRLEADHFVQEVADSLKDGSGIKEPEGLVLDPFGKPLRFTSTQTWFARQIEVRSSGPDGKFDTEDDLVRVRSGMNPTGIFSGVPWWGWGVLAYLVCGVLAVGIGSNVSKRRQRAGKPYRHAHPLLHGLALVILSPLVVVVYVVGTVTSSLGGGGDFDFDLDIDLF